MIPGFLLTFVEGMLGPSFGKFAKPLIYAVLIALLIGGLGVLKCSYDRSVVNKYQQKQQQQAADATNQAAVERGNDSAALNQSEQEMHNAVQSQPDQPISPTSRALSCERLRRVGRDPAACR